MQTNSRVVSESLESYAADLLAQSAFFSALSAGEADPGHVRDVFGQYYLWRNRFTGGSASAWRRARRSTRRDARRAC
jgi:hypothetical protein